MGEFVDYVGNITFTVKVVDGDVFINDKFVSQLCFNSDSVGYAVMNWLNGIVDDDE